MVQAELSLIELLGCADAHPAYPARQLPTSLWRITVFLNGQHIWS
jgi:hypothetical protein